ncbi:MAG TPA: MBL fold metallo-hydrolase [Spirochaetia bacterium]|nr:MBL fold metallo-hydrolase [Spirochaetia bacterium]
MNIGFYGAAGTVTGSQHLIEANGKKILLDCGLYQGKRAESFERNHTFPFTPSQVDILVLSHAHIDHSGNIPNLVKQGFQGDIYCTYATRDLAAVMLRDSAHIQEQDITYLNKKRARQGLKAATPLYETKDAVKSLEYFVGIGYGRSREIAPGITLTLHDAGHILGSAHVTLDITENGAEKPVRLVFSGDLGRNRRPIIRDPEPLATADVLIIESTYGDRLHEEESALEGRLREIISAAHDRGGKVIVPAFAVGRTQELVYSLNRLMQRGAIPDSLPIYVDSPLAVNATGIYRLHPEVWDSETEEFLDETGTRDPFGFSMMRYTHSVAESKNLNHLKGPAVIISASGMAETGRILHHLKNNIEDQRTTVLFVGYQAPYTLGRRLLDKTPRVKIFGEEYIVRARIEKIDGFSAHADKDELLAWVRTLKRPPRYTFVVHGEEESSRAFAEALRKENFPDVRTPVRGERRELS